ncbi:hypothetical protein AAFC00_000749 [Neodothiora populina]|uniref:TauD/TfdA-like domain-containing protein n=1 Tax=Neodothiora populina TaxID=2781224 RepID=A0ABR3PE03_9PEZI
MSSPTSILVDQHSSPESDRVSAISELSEYSRSTSLGSPLSQPDGGNCFSNTEDRYLDIPEPPGLSEADRIISERVFGILKSYSPATVIKRSPKASSFRLKTSIKRVVQDKKHLHFILPAFPFKSPNRIDKVLGALPDKGEELALARLDGLCSQIREVYPDTTLSIVSDGLVYNDILGVSDTDVWHYGSSLRELASRNCQHISFARLSSLVSDECPEPTTLTEYLENAQWYRDQLLQQHLPKGFDVDVALKEQINTLLTYRGYIKFLATDLKYEPSRQGLSKSKVKKMNETVAKRMIVRGAAFANAIEKAFPSSIRLSIHVSEQLSKLPVSLLSRHAAYTTPWHCTCAQELDGSWRFAHQDVFSGDVSYELVVVDGRQSHYRKVSDLYDWDDVKVDIAPTHPCGLLITPSNGQNLSMADIDMQKARGLAELNSPLVFRGFQDSTDRDLFVRKAREIGAVMPWKFGEVLVVKDAGTESGGLNNVLSAEPMPMHFDGLFKTISVKNSDGKERLVPQPPQFQWFTVATPSPENCGDTLLASSRLLFEHLPDSHPLDQLEHLTWTVSTTAFDNSTIQGLKLVVPHPTTKQPCLRYHEPWPSSRTRFDPTTVVIDDIGSEESVRLTNIMDSLLYDRRVCYYHKWVAGDLVLSDNISMMHTRTGFTPGAPRELWRIHIG